MRSCNEDVVFAMKSRIDLQKIGLILGNYGAVNIAFLVFCMKRSVHELGSLLQVDSK